MDERGALSVCDLSCRRGAFRLGPVNIDLGPGIHVLLGRNGAGKSTLFQTMLGLIPDRSGMVSIAGSRTSGGERAAAMRAVGYLPQRSQPPTSMTVEEAVGFAAWLKGVRRAETGALVDQALGSVGLDDRRRELVGRLSGGQQQRVAIAQTIVHSPSVLLLDEPTVGLDPAQRLFFYRVLRERVRGERCVLLSTHSLEDAAALADDVLPIVEGGVLPPEPVEVGASQGERMESLSGLVGRLFPADGVG